MNLFFPTLNSLLNLTSFVFLILGYIFIKQNKPSLHKACMLMALIASVLFLGCYLYYHYEVGSVEYPYQDWSRGLYLTILIPHVILATVMVPFILLVVFFAVKQNWIAHKKWAKRVWPVWVFVSLSGVVVYLMLYRPWLVF